MFSFHIDEAKSALATFEGLSDQQIGLYHALIVSPRPDAMGYSCMSFYSLEDNPRGSEGNHPKERALAIIEDSLFWPIKQLGVPPVVARNTIFLSDVLANGANSARSVFGCSSAEKVSKWTDQVTIASRRAYLSVRELLKHTPWHRIRKSDTEEERSRSDHAHLWLTGLELWANENGSIPCRRNFVIRSGKTFYRADGPDFDSPTMMSVSIPKKASEPPYLLFGNRKVYAPDDSKVAEELFGVTDDAMWFRIEIDICEASATVLRWVISTAAESDPKATMRVVDDGSNPGVQLADPKAPYMPVDWFKDEFGLTAESLRAQKRRKNLAFKKRGHGTSIPLLMRWRYGPSL